MVLKTFVLLLVATGAGIAVLRKGQHTLQRAVARDVDRPAPTFGDRFSRLDLGTAALRPSSDDHEDLLTPPKP